MAPQAVLEAGRLSAIAKILDRAGGHLSAAVVDDVETSGIRSLLDLSRSASYDVACAVRHAGTGDLHLAQVHLEAARTAPDAHAVATAGMPRPLPAGVRTALQLLRGISGFFSAETEDAFVRALSIDARPATSGAIG
ncbi:hypothetical protein G3I40_00660 [Streptomyces sp. SID14478]|uniref:hypothetical protein n=1 Tax=Streptomyces sp. SID14478 TaxID=2706073 RepID=UPI0013DB726B|nr:hypothetical protein [Streptomyces sp. SID14478]NEB73764.1 hypothetical protein [Streptomyces sp. SID14478]